MPGDTDYQWWRRKVPDARFSKGITQYNYFDLDPNHPIRKQIEKTLAESERQLRMEKHGKGIYTIQ